MLNMILGRKGKEEFVQNTQRKKALMHRNGLFEDGKIIYIEADWSLAELFAAASKRLDIIPTATRLFNSNGTNIFSVLQYIVCIL